jgi:hypothetical protein
VSAYATVWAEAVSSGLITAAPAAGAHRVQVASHRAVADLEDLRRLLFAQPAHHHQVPGALLALADLVLLD